MKKGTFWILSFLLVLSLMLSACSEVAPGEQEEEEEEEVTGAPQYGGTLNYGRGAMIAEDIEGWDPMCGWGGAGATMAPYLEGLFAGDASKGQTGTKEHTFSGRYIPPEVTRGELLESWEFSADSSRLIFHVRPGVYWQGKSGVMEARELTAADVAFNLMRRIDSPTMGVAVSPELWEWIDSVTATDKYTVTLELNGIYVDWAMLLGWGAYTPMIPPELIEAGIDDWRNAVGTGPFMLTDYLSGSYFEFDRNPNYWDTTIIDGKEYQLPFIDKLIYPIIPDQAAQVAALRTGKIDTWLWVPWQFKDTLAGTNPELRVWEREAWGHYEIHLRMDTPPFDIKDVRQAMSMAIDRETIIDTLYGGYGILDNFYYAKSWGEGVFTPMEKQPQAVQAAYEYNPEEARELLASAGFPDGFESPITLNFCNTPLEKTDIASLVKDNFAAIGIEVELLPHDQATDWGIVSSKSHEYMFLREGSAATPAHGLYSDYLPGAAENLGIVDDPVLNDMLDRYLLEADVDKSTALAKEINNYLIGNLITLYLPAPNTFSFAHPWVMNYEGEETTKYYSSINIITRIWLDQVLKEEMGY